MPLTLRDSQRCSHDDNGDNNDDDGGDDDEWDDNGDDNDEGVHGSCLNVKLERSWVIAQRQRKQFTLLSKHQLELVVPAFTRSRW